MSVKKKTIDPRLETTKVDEKVGADKKARRKAERKTGTVRWSDVGIKHAVTRLG